MTSSRPLGFRLAAVAGTAALLASGAQGVANAQLGSLAEMNFVPGSLGIEGVEDGAGNVSGSLNTTGSVGEPTLEGLGLGSAGPMYSELVSGSAFAQDDDVEGPVYGSLDSRFCGEATTENLLDCVTGSLGAGAGAGSDFPGSDQGDGDGDGDEGGTGSLDLGSVGGLDLPGSVVNLNLSSDLGSAGALLPVVLVGGSIAAGIAAAPMIQQALAGAGVALPPMPGSAAPAPMPGPAPAPAPAPAPGPGVDNGRGGAPGAGGGGAGVGATNHVTVMTGSLGDYDVELPAGVVLPPLPFIR